MVMINDWQNVGCLECIDHIETAAIFLRHHSQGGKLKSRSENMHAGNLTDCYHFTGFISNLEDDG